jgi:hypothetical protein
MVVGVVMGKARKRRASARASASRAQKVPEQPARPVRTAVWAAIVAAFTALVVAVVTGAAGQLVDVRAAKDWVRDVSDRVFSRSDASSASPDQLDAGAALRLSVLEIDGSYGQNAAFPPAPASAWAPFFRSPEMPAMSSLLAAGGYAAGGLTVKVSIESRRNQPITVFDVRPVRMVREDVPHGVLVYVLNQGSPLERMTFDLDRPHPIGHRMDDGQTSGAGRPFFDVESVDLPSSGSVATLSLEFTTLRWAYRFGVAIDYSVGGRNYIQELPPGPAGAYRVAADLCQFGVTKNRLPAADVKRLGGLHYQSVRTVVGTDDGSGFTLATRKTC